LKGWGGRRRGWGREGEMTQALYAHMNNKKINKNKNKNTFLPRTTNNKLLL
jgi:hypothetical protein